MHHEVIRYLVTRPQGESNVHEAWENIKDLDSPQIGFLNVVGPPLDKAFARTQLTGVGDLLNYLECVPAGEQRREAWGHIKRLNSEAEIEAFKDGLSVEDIVGARGDRDYAKRSVLASMLQEREVATSRTEGGSSAETAESRVRGRSVEADGRATSPNPRESKRPVSDR